MIGPPGSRIFASAFAALDLTLEAPFHYFTYRLKALQGELGGLPDQAIAAAAYLWPSQEQ